ncbi:hypothetical protein C8R43DRAFT_1132483 [Mycena crocata]|nr:hypothetical protein C8R43DRAFT_1132483 [Mycena crocata]
MSTEDKLHSLILPPVVEGINSDLAVQQLSNQLEAYAVADLSGWDSDGVPDPRILIGLGKYVFDVSKMKDAFGPNKLYSKYAAKDVSCALARNSYNDEDINAIGHSALSEKELIALQEWVSLFRLRFVIVGMLSGE